MDNFYATAERMYNDLDLLYSQKRWFNSCYFGGYVIECYSKIILSQISGKSPKEIRDLSHGLRNLNIELQTVVNTFIIGGKIPPAYLCDISTICPTICKGSQSWHPENRYSDGIGKWGKAEATEYYNESSEIILKLIQMKIDGVII